MSEKSEIKVAIVDDKLISRKKIKEKLENFEKKLKDATFIINFYENGVLFLSSENIYDLVLLDYEMPDKNGIQVANELEMRDQKPYVVFISGYDKLDKPMQRAVQLKCVVGFIFKSDSDAEFQFQIRNVLKELLNIYWIEFEYYLVEPVDLALERKREKRHYYVKKMDARKITHIKTTAKDVVTIYYAENESFTTTETLKMIFPQLPPKEFEYSDRGIIIHLGFVHSIGKDLIYLATDDELPLKPKYKAEFHKSYEDYLLQGIDDE